MLCFCSIQSPALWRFTASPLTFGGVQFVPGALTPARRVDVRGVGVHPEVMTVGVAVKVEPQPVTTDLDDRTHERIKTGWSASLSLPFLY